MKRVIYFLILCAVTACSSPTSAPPTYTFQASASPTEGGTITPQNGSFPEGQQVTVLATPSNGWRFIRWEGDLSSTQSSASLTMTKNMSVVGIFEKRDYPLNIVIEGNGSVEEEVVVARNYQFQTVVKLTAVPDDEWEFTGWSGDAMGDENPTEITITDETNITATFQGSAPKVRILNLTDVFTKSVTVEAEVTQSAVFPVTQVGICVATHQEPSVDDDCIQVDSATTEFTLRLEGLNASSSYYVIAFARNQNGVGYSDIESFQTPDVPPVEERFEDAIETATDIFPPYFISAIEQDATQIPENQREAYVDTLRTTISSFVNVLNENFTIEEFKAALLNAETQIAEKIGKKSNSTAASESCKLNWGLGFAKGMSVDATGSASLGQALIGQINTRQSFGSEIIYDFVNLERTVYAVKLCGVGAGLGVGVGSGFDPSVGVALSGFYRLLTNIQYANSSNPARFEGGSIGNNMNVRGEIKAVIGVEAGITVGVSRETEIEEFVNLSSCPVLIFPNIKHKGVTEYSLETSIGASTGLAEIVALFGYERAGSFRKAFEEHYTNWNVRDNKRGLASIEMAKNILSFTPIDGVSSPPGVVDLAAAALAIVYGSFNPEVCNEPLYLPHIETGSISSIYTNSATLNAQIVTDGGATVTQRGVCYAETPNPNLEHTCITSGSGSGSFNTTITGLSSSTTYFTRPYATNSVGTSYGDQVEFTTSSSSGSTDGRDNTTAVVDVYNPITGRTWMDRNLGASRAATSPTDAQAYGDLYQWGRGADGHEKRNSQTTSTLSSSDQPGHGSFILTSSLPFDWRSPQNSNLWQGVSGVNNPCPAGYRLPTIAEWNTERLSWGSNNASGGYNSPLKLPMAGVRNHFNGSLDNVGSDGYYWSNSEDGDAYAWRLRFDRTNARVNNSSGRSFGVSVRCLKD